MSKYGKEFAVPKEFPSVLKAFTREVLRAQPENIYEFGSQYFTELLAQAEAAQAAEAGGVRRLSRDELVELLTEMFHSADADSSGALSRDEFHKVLEMADLGLTDREVKRVMAEADMNDDGEISFEEFIPLGVNMIEDMYAKMAVQNERAAAEEDARQEAKNYLLHGMTKDEVEAVMMDIFLKSDADGSGALSLDEFRKCCKDADIGLTRKEINILMHQCDIDGDGNITYEEFVPLCFEMLTEILKDELMANRSPSELETYLLELCQMEDAEGTSKLSPLGLKNVLRGAELGLTRLQIHTVLSECAYDENGMAAYAKDLPTMASLMYKMLDMDAQIARANSLQEVTAGGADFTAPHGMDQASVEAALADAFAARDPAGTKLLDAATVKAVLEESPLGLSATEVNAIFSAGDEEGGKILYESIVTYAFHILVYLSQNAAVSY